MKVDHGGRDAEFPSQLFSFDNGTAPNDHDCVSIDVKLDRIVQTIDTLNYAPDNLQDSQNFYNIIRDLNPLILRDDTRL